MVTQVILPKLTYEMQEGRILEWLCSEGESVSKGQPLFVVETDKAAVEVPAEETLLMVVGIVPVAWFLVLPDPARAGCAGQRCPAIRRHCPSPGHRSAGDSRRV